MQIVTKGRVVFYVLADGQTRAADVTAAVQDNAEGRCNLTVKLDLSNDVKMLSLENSDLLGVVKSELIPEGAHSPGPFLLAAASVRQDEKDHAPGSWHFPPRV